MSWLDHRLIEQIGLSLLHFLWQGAVIGLLYAITLPATRGASARIRYVIAVATLAALAAAPLLTFALLRFSAGPEGAASTGAVELIRWTVSAGSGEAGGLTLMQWIVAAWAAGVLVLSARLLIGWHFLRRLRRSADYRAAGDLLPTLRALTQRLGIDRPVALAVSKGIRSPVVIGWLKPLVLLPPAIVAGLPARQLEMVLAHELAHVRRLDHLVNLCQTIVETALFYHPVVRWVSHRIRVERENACDDLAVAVTDDRLAYVEMLASLERLRFQGPRLALGLHDGQMLSRIRRLVEGSGPARQLGLTGPALLAGLILAALGSLSLIDEDAVTDAGPAESAVAEIPASTPPRTEAVSPRPEPAPEPAGEPAAGGPVQAAAASRPLEEAAETVATSSAGGGRAAPEENDFEPPSAPRMETDRLPPVAELVGRPDGRELAMLDRPALTAPELPDPIRPAIEPREETITGGGLIRRVQPLYPEEAREQGVDGRVEVEFLVTPAGRVHDIRILDEAPRGLAFAEAAREAIGQWRFEPFRRGEEPIERRVRLEMSFDLGQGDRRECRDVLGSRIPRCY
jgi:TonB family protein